MHNKGEGFYPYLVSLKKCMPTSIKVGIVVNDSTSKSCQFIKEFAITVIQLSVLDRLARELKIIPAGERKCRTDNINSLEHLFLSMVYSIGLI